MSSRKLNQQQLRRIRQRQRARHNDNSPCETQETDGTLGPQQQGLVIAHHGRQLNVEPIGQAGQVFCCHLRANLPPLVTGDRVMWRAGTDGIGVITARIDRSSLLVRPSSRNKFKPVAANIDYILLVLAPEPAVQPTLIDRYLIAAEMAQIEPLLILNKSDLSACNTSYRAQFTIYQSLGYRLFPCSAASGWGLDALINTLKDKACVLVGQSGVGKSSLTNVLVPHSKQSVNPLSTLLQQGKHTTSSAQLFHLPQGGTLIDSPGVRDFGLWHMDQSDILAGFREFHAHLGNCQFRDCQHAGDAGCALEEAVRQGVIHQSRWHSFLSIVNTYR